MNLAALDLNLLLVYEALLLERGVGRAGKRIGLSQPAVSNALGRLRATLGDALFVRSGATMVPTARATQLSTPILDALNRIRAAIGDGAAFAPSTAEIRFRIHTSDYGEALLIAPLLGRIRSIAPNVTLLVRRTTSLFELPVEELRSDTIDFSIGFFPDVLPPGSGLMGSVLMRDRLVAVSAKKRARALTLHEFSDWPQVRLNLGRESPGLIDDALARRGLRREIVVTLPDFASIPAVVAQTDLLAVLPERLARLMAPHFRLHIHRLPLEIQPLSVTLVWHQRNQDHPAHIWLRDQLREVAGAGVRTSRAAPRIQRMNRAPS
jgi:DNA-binding transcriptional LysR family regulator